MNKGGREINVPLTVLLLRVLAVVAVLLVWEVAARLNWIDVAFAGQPSKIGVALYGGLIGSGDIWPNLGWTLTATWSAFVLGSLAAIAIGMLFVMFPILYEISSPVLSALNAIPRIALAPMLIVWLGLGIASKIAIGFSMTFFIVLEATVAAGRNINADHIVLARTLGLSSAGIFWKITMPGAVPIIFSGLRLGLVYSLLGVVGGEIIASVHGLGQRIAYLASAFDMNGVWSILFVLSIFGVALSSALERVEKHLVRWK